MTAPIATLRAARANPCRWCGGAPTRPGLSHGLCRSCRTRMEVETMPDRTEFLALAIEAGVPRNIADGLTRYVYDRVAPGGFLRAVLENDLHRAIREADANGMASLRALMVFCHNEVPMGWYGTTGSVAGHLSERRVVA